METSAISAVVGTKFRGLKAIEQISQMRDGDVVQLEREPQNAHDWFAIAVHFGGVHCGYLPRVINARIADIMDRGVPVAAVVVKTPTVIAGKVKTEPALRLTWTP